MYTPSECYPKKSSFLSINNLFWIYYKGTLRGVHPTYYFTWIRSE
jgi:hypothetical protein